MERSHGSREDEGAAGEVTHALPGGLKSDRVLAGMPWLAGLKLIAYVLVLESWD